MLSIQSFADESLYVKLWIKSVKNVMSKQYAVLLITQSL
jgi:protoheme ferro-lyase